MPNIDRPVFLSLTQLARVLGRDHRSVAVRSISPAGFVQHGNRLLPIYAMENGAAQGSTNSTGKNKE
jgi:hypothetical protein